jgi:hypothetical protein
MLSEYFEHPETDVGISFELRVLHSPLLEHPEVFVGVPDAIVAMRYKRTTDALQRPRALLRVRRASLRVARATIRTRKEAVPVPRDAVLIPCDALLAPRDASLVSRGAVPTPRDAPPFSRDAVPVPRDAVGIPRDAVPVLCAAVPVPRDNVPTLSDAALVHCSAVPVSWDAVPVPCDALPVRRSAMPVLRDAPPAPRDTARAPPGAVRVSRPLWRSSTWTVSRCFASSPWTWRIASIRAGPQAGSTLPAPPHYTTSLLGLALKRFARPVSAHAIATVRDGQPRDTVPVRRVASGTVRRKEIVLEREAFWNDRVLQYLPLEKTSLLMRRRSSHRRWSSHYRI